MDKNRFETQKHVVNLDPKAHPIQNYFTVEDLKWLIEQAEKIERLEEDNKYLYNKVKALMNARPSIKQAEKVARFSNMVDELQKELIEKDEKLDKLKNAYYDKEFTPVNYIKVSAEVFED